MTTNYPAALSIASRATATPGLETASVTCYVMAIMPSTPRKKRTAPKTPAQRMQARRDRLRAQGLRPVQHWVPDLRDPKVLADLRRQGELMARHPENAEIDRWIEQVSDWSDWR